MRAAERVTQSPDVSASERLVEEHYALIARIAANRDRDAFEALFLHFGPRIKTLMLKGGASHAQAEDMAQDVMMTVWRKVEQYRRDRGSVSAWIFTIARNARIDRLRRASSRPYQDVDSLDIASDEPGADDEAIASQRAGLVADALAELPYNQRQIIELAYMHDLPHSRIAEKLSLPMGTVKSRMRLAYAKLRTRLEEAK